MLGVRKVAQTAEGSLLPIRDYSKVSYCGSLRGVGGFWLWFLWAECGSCVNSGEEGVWRSSVCVAACIEGKAPALTLTLFCKVQRDARLAVWLGPPSADVPSQSQVGKASDQAFLSGETESDLVYAYD